jgi:hypothetical protein
MHQRDEHDSPGATFGVGRVSRFLGGATRVGATLAMRDDDGPRGRNVVTAVDAITRIGEQIQLSATLSTSTDSGRTGIGATYYVFRDSPRLYTGILGALVTKDYDPRTGFVSRPDVFVTSPAVTWTVQPEWRPRGILWFKPGFTTYFYHDPSSRRFQEGSITLRTEVVHTNGASWLPWVERSFQRPIDSLSILPGVIIAPGTHDYTRLGLTLKSDQSARIATTADVSNGAFYDGSLAQAVLTARWSPSPWLATAMSYEVNRFSSLGARDTTMTTHLAGPELRVFLNPRVQWSAFYQHNTLLGRGTLNARFSWEFAPLSYLYVVYNDRQAVLTGSEPRANSLIVKLSWLRQL